MQHPTEPLAALDATTGWRCRRQRQDQAIVEPLVIPFVVVVRDELADGATPRALADQDHALEAGFLDGAHEALRVGVQVRRPGGASDGGDIGRGERVAHGRPEERVAVMDEEPSLSQASVLDIGGVPHELGAPRPMLAPVAVDRSPSPPRSWAKTAGSPQVHVSDARDRRDGLRQARV